MHPKWLEYYTVIKEEKIHQHMQTGKPSGPNSAQDWIQFSKAVLTHAHGSETHKSVWVACAYNLHSLRLYITISWARPHSHTWTHGIPLVGGCDDFCASHSEVIEFKNSSTSQLPSPWRQPDVVQCTSPPLHMQASPEGRVKRHLLPFPPAAAENNQGETKSQATQS